MSCYTASHRCGEGDCVCHCMECFNKTNDTNVGALLNQDAVVANDEQVVLKEPSLVSGSMATNHSSASGLQGVVVLAGAGANEVVNGEETFGDDGGGNDIIESRLIRRQQGEML